MDINLLNEKLERIDIIRKYKSLTWNTYYNSQGDFSLLCPLETFKRMNIGDCERFIEIPIDNHHIGIIESINKNTSDDGEIIVTIKGRMADSLLDRRVQLTAKEYKNKLPIDIVNDVLNQNFISPDDENRTLSLITFNAQNQPEFSKIDYELLRGLDCAYILHDICSLLGAGLSVRISKNFKNLEVLLYLGTDRSLDQNNNTPVVIHQKRGTVLNISYFKNTTGHKTWAAVDKEFDVPTSFPLNSDDGLQGLKRRETYFDLSSMSQTIIKADGTEVVIEDRYYENMIQNEAKTRLSKLVITESLDSVVPKNIAKDFRHKLYLGDIVTVHDEETGLQIDTIISGSTEVWSENGYELMLQIGEDSSNYSQDYSVHSGGSAAKTSDGGNTSPSSIDLYSLIGDGSGSHNCIYRGKYLGNAVTESQYAAIMNGTFKDLFIGDYWTIAGINYRIASFDYYYGTGDTVCNTHHVVIVPDSALYTARMNSTNSTTGAYVGSEMYKSNLNNAKSTILAAFGNNHILQHRKYLHNTMQNNSDYVGSWYNSTVELMSENNVYGCKFYGNQINGTTLVNNATIDKTQYQLFQHMPEHILTANNYSYWLRNVSTGSFFSYVFYKGLTDAYNASTALGVRPSFSIVG